MADVRFLDELAANATTAGTVQQVGGWRLRAAPDLPFRRSSSTLPFGDTGPLAGSDPVADVAARIDIVERFYRDRGLPARFVLSPAAEPGDLDARLAARGYTIDSPVDLLIAPTDRVIATTARAEPPQARLADTIDLDWVAAFGEGRSRLEGYARLLAEIEPRHAVVVVDFDRVPAAIGVGVLERGWVGIFGMATRSTTRRRGAARAVIRALSQWAQDGDAHDLYLQVETDNAPARGLYESVGFVRNHGYHYRVLA